MMIIHSLVIIACALAFLFIPLTRFCYAPGANIGGGLWLFFVVPFLLIAVNVMSEPAVTRVTAAQALFLLVVTGMGCWQNAETPDRRRVA